MYPILARLGDVTFHTYGVVMMFSLFTIYFLALRARDPELLERAHLGDISFLVVFSIWFGGGLVLLIQSGDFSVAALRAGLDPRGLHRVGTMAITAAFFVLLSGYCLWKGLPFWRVFDFLMPYFVLGYGLQRTFGCFSAGCCYGTTTELPWGVIFGENVAGGAPSGVRIHPTQLYMGLAALGASRMLHGQRNRCQASPGALTGLGMVALFGIYFAVSFWRGDLKGEILWWGLEKTQWLSLILTGLGALLWIFPRRWITPGSGSGSSRCSD